jgi:penicillin G amidase
VLAGETRELERRTIEVPVKEGPAEQRTVDLTEVGPVVNTGGDHLIALRWSALEIDDHLPDAVRALNRAGSVSEVLEKVQGTPLMVAQNLVVADVDGDYAWQQVGALVQRKAHTGRVPYPGSDPAHGWSGWLSEAPGEHHPERHWVRSANSRPDHPLSHAISTSYVPPLRLERIDERIGAAGSHDAEAQHQIQLDARELLAARYRDPLLDGVTPESDRARQCRDLLAGWDLEAGADSVGAAVWALFLDAYVRHAIEDDLGATGAEIARSVLGSGRNPLGNGLFDATFVEDRARSVSYALDRACADLSAGWGDDPAGWTWGAVHPLVLRHPFADRAPKLLKSWNMAPVPFPGSGSTVAAAGYPWGPTGERPVTGMPSMRVVMPLDDLGASTLVYPGGQSGQPKSTLYTSHYVHYVTGGTLPLWFDDEDVAANAVHTAVLRPAR